MERRENEGHVDTKKKYKGVIDWNNSFIKKEGRKSEMKSYKEMAEAIEKKINGAMDTPDTTPFYVCGLIDSWIAFAERDTETPEEVMQKKYEKVLTFIENKLENVEPHNETGDRSINLTFSYIAIRQKLETYTEEKKARLIHLQP